MNPSPYEFANSLNMAADLELPVPPGPLESGAPDFLQLADFRFQGHDFVVLEDEETRR